MSQRESYQIDEYLQETAHAYLSLINGLETLDRIVPGSGRTMDDPVRQTEGAVDLEMFTDLHLQAYAHEYRFGSRLSVCNSIFRATGSLLNRSYTQRSELDHSRLAIMFDYARSANDQVPQLVEPELHRSLAALVDEGATSEEEFAGRDDLRLKGLTFERMYGSKLEVTPSDRGRQVVEAQRARDAFDSVHEDKEAATRSATKWTLSPEQRMAVAKGVQHYDTYREEARDS